MGDGWWMGDHVFLGANFLLHPLLTRKRTNFKTTHTQKREHEN